MLSITDFATADALYQGEGLAIPTLPAALEDLQVRQVTSTTFATTPLEGAAANLYACTAFLDAALHGALPLRTAAFGFDGHGFTSQAIHYYITTPQVVILLQVPWGGYTGDPDAQRRIYTTLHAQSLELANLATAAANATTFPLHNRLIVVIAFGAMPRMAWYPQAAPDAEVGMEPDSQFGSVTAIAWSYGEAGEILQEAIQQIQDARWSTEQKN